MYMRWSLFLLSVCVALSACSMTPENPSETSEIFSGLNEDLEEKPLEVLYHGGNPLTPEDTLSKVLIETSEKVPVCPTCKAEMRATLTNSEKLLFKNKAVSAWLKELMVYTIFFFLMSGNVLLVDTQKGPTLQKVHML